MIQILVGLGVIAAAATAGDFIWYSFGVRHRMVNGLLHGALLLTVVGGVLGAASGRVVKGLPIGMLAGVGGAMAYYAIIAAFGGTTYGAAIPASWVFLWILLAALDGRWLRAPRVRPWSSVLTRGAIAAVAGGIAFYLVMGVLWGRPPAGGRNYLLQFLAWAFAWAPGVIALTWGESGPPSRGRSTAAAPHNSETTYGASNESVTDSAGSEASITGPDLAAKIAAGERVPILDVRSAGEFGDGHVPGAVNVPFNQVSSRLADVPGAPGEELIVYCGHGPRAYIAAVSLRHAGERRVVYLRGHWSGWQSAGLPQER